MTKKGEKNQTDSFSPTRVKPIIPATHFLLLSPKKYSDKYHRSERKKDGIRTDNSRNIGIHETYYYITYTYSDKSGDYTDKKSFYQKLRKDIAPQGSKRFSNTDFPSPFRNRYEHNIHNSDTSDYEGNSSNSTKKERKSCGNR